VSFRTPDPAPSYSVITSQSADLLHPVQLATAAQPFVQGPRFELVGCHQSFCGRQLSKSVDTALEEDSSYNAAWPSGDRGGQLQLRVTPSTGHEEASSPSAEEAMRSGVEVLVPVYDWLHSYLTRPEDDPLAAFQAAVNLEGCFWRTSMPTATPRKSSRAFLARWPYTVRRPASGIVSRAIGRYNNEFWASARARQRKRRHYQAAGTPRGG